MTMFEVANALCETAASATNKKIATRRLKFISSPGWFGKSSQSCSFQALRQAEGADQKHGHLSARRRPVRTEQRRIRTAPACDSFMVELLDPRRGESRDRYIIEYCSRGRWRRIRRPMLAHQKENRHLGSSQ